MIDIYETITILQKEKEAKGVMPTDVIFEEILLDVREQVKEEIRRLCRERKIEFHKTLNSTSFNIVKQQQQ